MQTGGNKNQSGTVPSVPSKGAEQESELLRLLAVRPLTSRQARFRLLLLTRESSELAAQLCADEFPDDAVAAAHVGHGTFRGSTGNASSIHHSRKTNRELLRDVRLEFTGKKEPLKRHRFGWCVVYHNDSDPIEVIIAHRAYLLLLAYIVSALRGERGISSADPCIAGKSIARVFTPRGRMALAKPRQQIQEQFKPFGIMHDIVEPTSEAEGEYRLALPVSNIALSAIRTSNAPDVRSLLKFLPKQSR